MKRRLLVALVILCTVLTPILAAGPVGATAGASSTTDGASEALGASSLQDNNTTSTSTPTSTPNGSTDDTGASSGTTSGGPTTAETIRILPVQLEADFVNTEVAKQGEMYNTTGPFAFFSTSEPVEKAAVQQEGAKATVLEGGRTVRVQYDSDAAPVGKQSLFNLQLWFDDGSSRSIELYAEKTSVSVGAAEMKKYRPVILTMLSDAEKAGYERDPDGLEAHYQDVKETAQLLDSLFTEQAKRLFGSVVGVVMNPLGIAALLIMAALIALWQLRRNSQALEILTNDSGKAARLRERLWIEYKNQQQTAADEQLRELKGVGEMGEIYWKDAFGVDTTAGLAELFRQGIPVMRDGEVKHVGGVEELDAETIESSWLEAVCRENRLPSQEIALSHGKTALHRMISKFGMAHHYQDAYENVRELMDELDESRDVTRHSATSRTGTSSRTPSGSGAATGGDD